jgi:hypothetical protein
VQALSGLQPDDSGVARSGEAGCRAGDKPEQTPAPVGSVSPEAFFDLFGLTGWNELGQRYTDNGD